MNTTGKVAAPQAAPDSNWKNCQACGGLLSSKAEICPKCGAPQTGPLSKTILLLLTFFGGGLGLHKFYLRKPVQGIFYILFCWTGIPGLIALVEFIVYAFTSEERLNQKYQATSSGMVILIAAAAVFFMIVIIGILAAIAIPAYHDYTLRARVSQAVQQIEPLRMKVENHIFKTGAIPAAPSEIPDIAPVQVQNIATAQVENDGVIVIRFDQLVGKPIAGSTIAVTPYLENGRLLWRCVGGDLPAKYRPTQCRAP